MTHAPQGSASATLPSSTLLRAALSGPLRAALVRPQRGRRGSPARDLLAAGPFLLALFLAACATPADLAAEPRALIFSPARDDLELRLVNHTSAPLSLTRFRLDPRDPDWGAFVLKDRELPREIAGHGSVSLHLHVDREHFAGAHGTRERQGLAHLLFQAGSEPHAIALRYQPHDPSVDLFAALTRSALLLAALALAWALARRNSPRAPLPWTTWLPALVLLGLLPGGLALCPAWLGEALSQADLEQCAERRGGQPLVLLALAEGWLLYLLALVLAGLARLAHAARDLPRATLASRLTSRDLALALAFAGPLLSFRTLDPTVLGSAQAAPLIAAISWLPRWGCFLQPLAALAAIAVVAAPHTSKLERFHFATALALLFFGGATLPASLSAAIPHGLASALMVIALTLKILALTWLLRRLTQAPPGSPARTRLLTLERLAVPLLILNLLFASLFRL